jgi:REP element-mobilizing transposase RayT
MLHRKSSRLDRSNYIGYGIYFLAICCDHRRPYLANPEIAIAVRTDLLKSATKTSFSLHAYCLMRDPRSHPRHGRASKRERPRIRPVF